MGIVNEAVQDGVGVGIVADGVMPGRHWKLAGDDGGAAAIAIFQDFEQIVASLGIEGLKAPVVQDQQFNLAQAFEFAGDAPVTAREREILQQAGEAGVEDRAVVAASLVSDGAGQPALADAGGAAQRQIVMGIDPVTLEQGLEEASIQAACAAIIDVFWRGLMAQPGVSKTGNEALVMAMRHFPIEQQAQPFGMVQRRTVTMFVEFAERLGHAVQAQRVELIKGRMGKHNSLLQW